MDKPIFEIPVTPPGDDADGWTPTPASPTYTPQNPDAASPFDAILFDAPPSLPLHIDADTAAGLRADAIQPRPVYQLDDDKDFAAPAVVPPPLGSPTESLSGLDFVENLFAPTTYAEPATAPTYELDDYSVAPKPGSVFSLDDIPIEPAAPGSWLSAYTEPSVPEIFAVPVPAPAPAVPAVAIEPQPLTRAGRRAAIRHDAEPLLDAENTDLDTDIETDLDTDTAVIDTPAPSVNESFLLIDAAEPPTDTVVIFPSLVQAADALPELGVFAPPVGAVAIELDSGIAHEDVTTAVIPTSGIPTLAVDHVDSAQRVDDPELLAALRAVVDQDGSDLHVTAGAPPSIRIDGSLRPLEGHDSWMPNRVTSALHSLLSDDQRDQFERELELDFAYTIAGSRFRVNYYQQRGSIGGAFRLIPRGIKQLEDLGLPESIGRFSQLARGLVLVTGPTGSGKSTTLASLIDLVNRTRTDHIVTVEDPIEFLHSHQKSLVNQREVGSDTHSFAAALKHVLRQDPDVILIGELRDLETISVALTAAETGHLVFATLHTQDAAQTIDRVIDVFPPHQQSQVRAQLAATLQGVVCQTLVRKANGRGRVVATEVLVTTPAIGNLIREGKTYQISSMMQAGRDLGMHTMDQHLADLVNSGQITHEAAEEKSHDLEALGQLVRRANPADAAAMATSSIDFGDSFSLGAH